MRRLTEHDVADYLRERGVIGTDETVVAAELGGGVSSDVLAVTGERVDLVVKQGLEKLRVAAEWFAPPQRVLTEAAALQLAARIRPDDVPVVLDVDAEALALTVTRAERQLRLWKADLLDGHADPATATRLGDALADWHTRTWGDPEVLARFDQAAFVDLRVDPFHRTVALAHPDLAGPIQASIDELTGDPRCLVHGDFSPKNILAAGDRICVLDWEVAHAGNPVFDVAFLLTHLLLKAVRRPSWAGRYRAAAEAFLAAYRAGTRAVGSPPQDVLDRQVACLLLARVDGKSPVEYLGADQRAVARQVGREVLAGDRPDLWERVGELA